MSVLQNFEVIWQLIMKKTLFSLKHIYDKNKNYGFHFCFRITIVGTAELILVSRYVVIHINFMNSTKHLMYLTKIWMWYIPTKFGNTQNGPRRYTLPHLKAVRIALQRLWKSNPYLLIKTLYLFSSKDKGILFYFEFGLLWRINNADKIFLKVCKYGRQFI